MPPVSGVTICLPHCVCDYTCWVVADDVHLLRVDAEPTASEEGLEHVEGTLEVYWVCSPQRYVSSIKESP